MYCGRIAPVGAGHVKTVDLNVPGRGDIFTIKYVTVQDLNGYHGEMRFEINDRKCGCYFDAIKINYWMTFSKTRSDRHTFTRIHCSSCLLQL